MKNSMKIIITIDPAITENMEYSVCQSMCPNYINQDTMLASTLCDCKAKHLLNLYCIYYRNQNVRLEARASISYNLLIQLNNIVYMLEGLHSFYMQ